jgi:hypothetical protein
MSARLIPLVALAAFTLTGCTKTIDENDLEGTIADSIGKQLGGQKPKVDCPSGKKAKKGSTFECDATLAGEKTKVVVKLTDDSGKFTFTVKQPAK